MRSAMRWLFLLLPMIWSCNTNTSYMNDKNENNHLANESSPYLLQHADNPVNWYPWGKEALSKAKEEDKPILVSIGYSSCHWCHVMAHESFEDSSVAAIMNEHFINIKVDREERPDVDQVYMDAVQAMGLNGGWPLNVFLTPDQKPFYGGTYFPKETWMDLLRNVNNAFENKREQLDQSADRFAEALNRNLVQQFKLDHETPVTPDDIMAGFFNFSAQFDSEWGGVQGAPKFPMPSDWKYLYYLQDALEVDSAKEHFLFTLDKIRQGGIYDHVGGGFSRYSVDGEWHVPHFEKMLYDNGQLLSVYAMGYKLTGKAEYKTTILETVSWLKREMFDESGGFYAALDADSDGEEGKYYVWTREEFESLAGDNSELLSKYFNVLDEGNWEHGKNVLRLLQTEDAFTMSNGLSISQLDEIVADFRYKALAKRSNRIRPGLDNKLISGWNGLALTGLLDAYQATREEELLALIKNLFNFLNNLISENGSLKHLRKSDIPGFLDDYAAVIQAFVKYYETTFDENALHSAELMTDYVIKNFYDEKENLFFYSGKESTELIARKKEFFDNVIPSSNSIMAENLHKLGILLDNDAYKSLSAKMVNQVSEMFEKETRFLSNWATVALMHLKPTPEIAIVGEDFESIAADIHALAIPNKVVMGTAESSELPILRAKTASGGKTTIYVCFNKTCKLPVHTVEEALKQIP